MLDTVRHLSARQAAAWIHNRLERQAPVRLDLRGPAAAPSAAWDALAAASRALDELGGLPASTQAESRRIADMVLSRRFRFVGEERELPIIDWTADYVHPLWTYHLHYFDYAVDLARVWRHTGEPRFGDRLAELWTTWLDAAARGDARIEPYPTSVRCMNTLRCLWLVENRLSPELAERLRGAVDVQLRWLAGHLERHLRANHLQKNLAALTWGGLAFSDAPDRDARRAELWWELGEQVLPDGGHFERSPMYHAEALDDLLRTVAFCRVAGVPVPDDAGPRLVAMTRALQWLSRPDGSLHRFNDAADGERPGRSEVIGLARRVLGRGFEEPTGVFALADTGYCGVVEPELGLRLVVDAGPLGPDYQPGHAHCDMLSFELDVAGRPAIVDAGVHGYDGNPYREYVRSTRAHNTVAIDGGEQHEMWATYRVAGRGAIVGVPAISEDGAGVTFHGACRHHHDPRAEHHRRIHLGPDRMTVTDAVADADDRPLTSWLHLHPDFEVRRVGDGFVAEADSGDGASVRIVIEPFGADDARVLRGERDPVQGWYCPEFGVARPACVIELELRANRGRPFGWRLKFA